jgi:adenylylsulfate kinase
MSFAVWLTGLSGSGKSAIAKQLLQSLHEKGVDAAVLESDVMRTQLTPFPGYDEQDRAFFYGALCRIGAMLVAQGRPVIFDATANRRGYRDAARKAISRFAEVYVDTPLEICAARDTKGLYRSQDVKMLPGAQSPYEPPLAPELVVHGDRGMPGQGAARIVDFLQRCGWLHDAG